MARRRLGPRDQIWLVTDTILGEMSRAEFEWRSTVQAERAAGALVSTIAQRHDLPERTVDQICWQQEGRIRWWLKRRARLNDRVSDPDDPGQSYKGRWLTGDPTSCA